MIGLYQYCGNRGCVGHVSVLRWCRWVAAWNMVWKSGMVLCLCEL